ncbi:uncharacterized protein BDZ83DRAFT_279105 [Colletotrichum acutatum]|uniref:Uncharacterized protein n=1 Tax=Glomerella acutata TaxID=27357 RepID=A0AAD8UM50_GLOAC|nr:uncharacterized protein BDZ83DRAFT_279105 [Colletotrichum acutatum]KAK1725898.1 hypothetical protein BDZ83DRAFT_279105 [Colletotrichum acutatum]
MFVYWVVSDAKLEPRGVAWSLSMYVLFSVCWFVSHIHLSCRYCFRRLNHLGFGSLRRGEKGPAGEKGGKGAFVRLSVFLTLQGTDGYSHIQAFSRDMLVCLRWKETTLVYCLIIGERAFFLLHQVLFLPLLSALGLVSSLAPPNLLIVPHVPRRRRLKVGGLVAIDLAISRARPARPRRQRGLRVCDMPKWVGCMRMATHFRSFWVAWMQIAPPGRGTEGPKIIKQTQGKGPEAAWPSRKSGAKMRVQQRCSSAGFPWVHHFIASTVETPSPRKTSAAPHVPVLSPWFGIHPTLRFAQQ